MQEEGDFPTFFELYEFEVNILELLVGMVEKLSAIN